MQTIVSAIFGEGFSPLGEMGPPKGEETAFPTTLSGLGSANSLVSSISMSGGSAVGGALRKPSLCKQHKIWSF